MIVLNMNSFDGVSKTQNIYEHNNAESSDEYYTQTEDNEMEQVVDESSFLQEELDYLQAFVDAQEFQARPFDGETDNVNEQKTDAKPANKPLLTISTDCDHAASHSNLHTLEESFCKNYTCCGLVLRDMHELLQHYEECHVLVEEDGYSDAESSTVDPRSPVMVDSISAFDDHSIQASTIDDIMLPHDNPLIRRVGDVEDDLGIRALEWMHEEFERGGKRMKMSAESVIPSTIEPATIVTSHHSDEEIDVVTVDLCQERNANESDFDFESSKLFDECSKIQQNINNNSSNNSCNDKPYRCTYPGCDKAYKNPNGLKYHNLHGHCGGDDDDMDYAARLMKPYVCNDPNCYKRYKNLNGLKYHIEKSHGFDKTEANQIATEIVKKTNARYGINARSVPATVLFAAIKEHEEREKSSSTTGSLINGVSKPLTSTTQLREKEMLMKPPPVNLAPKSEKLMPLTGALPLVNLKKDSTNVDSPTYFLSPNGVPTLFFPTAANANNAHGQSKSNVNNNNANGATNQTILMPAYIQALAAAGYLKFK